MGHGPIGDFESGTTGVIGVRARPAVRRDAAPWEQRRPPTTRYRGQALSVVIPCYNEEHGLARVLAQVPPEVGEVLVLDNCSTDATVEVARAGGEVVRVLCNPTNLGYGGSYLRGFEAAAGDVLVTTDGDGTYPIADCLRLVDVLLDNDLDFLTCSRFPLADRAAMTPRNRLGNWVLNSLVRGLYGIRLSDAQSGMWVIRASALDGLDLSCTGMSFSNEIKLEAFTKLGGRAAEVGIGFASRVGESKLMPFRDGMRMVRFIVTRRVLGPARAAGRADHANAGASVLLRGADPVALDLSSGL
jgi:hypothetical protein